MPRVPVRRPPTPPVLRWARLGAARPASPADALRRMGRRLGASVLVWPLGASVLGVLLAVLSGWVDQTVPAQAVPTALWVEADTASLLLATLAGVLVTVVAVLFWVRAAAVQLAAGQLSARVLQSYLGDRFQQATMGFVVGTFVHVVAVLWALPAQDASQPHLSALGAVALVVGAVLMILTAVVRSSHALRASAVADRIAETAIQRIQDQAIPGDDDHRVGQRAWREPPAAESEALQAHGSGWVCAIDEEQLLASVPPGAVVRLQVRLGDFVTRGATLAEVWLPRGSLADDASRAASLRAAFALGDARDLHHDVAYALRLLGDIAQRALAPGTNDFGAAQEAIVRLGAVLREVLVREPPVTPRTDDEDRWLLRPRDLDARGYVREAFERVRVDGARYPSVAAELLRTLGMLRQAVLEAGLDEHEPALCEQAELVLDSSAHAGLLPADLGALEELAVALGLRERAPTPANVVTPAEGAEASPIAAASALSGTAAVADDGAAEAASSGRG